MTNEQYNKALEIVRKQNQVLKVKEFFEKPDRTEISRSNDSVKLCLLHYEFHDKLVKAIIEISDAEIKRLDEEFEKL